MNITIRTCTKCSYDYQDYGQKSSMCRPCKRAYDREYHKNRSDDKKKRKQELQLLRLKENRKYLYNFYSENPCTECGEERVAALQLDHVDPSSKHKSVANMLDCSLVRLKEEISKCRVLCANCHAVHTAKQFNWYKDLV